MHIDDDINNCNVEKIDGDDLISLFRHIFKLSKITGIVLPKSYKDIIKYQGTAILHGVVVEVWEVCETIDKETNKFTLSYSAGNWITASGAKNIPIRCQVKSQTIQNGKTINIEYLIEFSDYNPTSPNYQIFEIPKETYCKGSDYKKDLPKLEKAFSAGLERINLGSQYPIRINQYEYYDFQKKLFRLDYYENVKGNTGYLAGPLTQIHDYNTHTAYIITRNEMKCEMKSIEEISALNKQLDDSTDRLKNSKEMFHLDKFNYIYEGQRTIRGILCDVWIAHRNDYPIPKSSLSIWEWYFASDDAVLDIGEREEINFPVRLEVKHDESDTYTVLNIYNYDEDFQLYSTFDIDKCFGVDNRFDYTFEIIGSYDSVVNEDEEGLKYEIRSSLFGIGKVSPLRISNIQIDEGDDTVIVSFSLLDVPPGNKANETDLATAAKALVNEISNNQLVITTSDNRKLKTKPNLYSNVIHLKERNTGSYSPGSMAGIGIGMLLVGGLIGYVLGKFIVKKKKLSTFKGMKFENVEN